MPAAFWATEREVALVEDIRAATLEIPVGGVAYIVGAGTSMEEQLNLSASKGWEKERLPSPPSRGAVQE